ncbi:hypothetical protein V7659_26140, partial [Neobacillus drentensis]|uniref:hypothetical protein n=1 Tax=Neobacillus drentensis TaxID=220684 RepID=UPI002FFFAF6E
IILNNENIIFFDFCKEKNWKLLLYFSKMYESVLWLHELAYFYQYYSEGVAEYDFIFVNGIFPFNPTGD